MEQHIVRLDLLLNPVFWAVHSYEQTRADNWLEDFFGLSSSELQTFWQREMPSVVPGEPDMVPCYCFPLPLPGGYSALVEYEAYPEDFGIAYSIHHPSWDSPLLLSRYPSGCDWPPFRWEEAVTLADAVQGATGKTTIGRAALPLIFPGVWLTPGDDIDQVRLRLRLAWGELQVAKPDHLEDMAAKMVEAQGIFEPWQSDPTLGWVNNGRNYRNPEHSPVAFFERVREFFAAVCRTSDS